MRRNNQISRSQRSDQKHHDLDNLRAKIRHIEQQKSPLPKNGASWLSPACSPPSIVAGNQENTENAEKKADTAPAQDAIPTHVKEPKIDRSHKGGKGQGEKRPKRHQKKWSFGIDAIDAALPQNQLSQAALHEIKPASYRDSHAAISFAMALAGRRLHNMSNGALLWCLPPQFTREFGMPYGPGMRRLIANPENCIFTEPRTEAHFLWAMEEGLGLSLNQGTSSTNTTGALALVLGMTKTVQPTPARRLSLRASVNKTPAILLTHHDAAGINMAATRWRIARAESEPGSHLTTAPGRAKWHVTLERAPHGKEALKWILEWHHETHSFTLVTPLANRAPQTTSTRFSSLPGPLRAYQ